MDRKQTSSSTGTGDGSSHTTIAQRRASLLKRPSRSSLDPALPNRPRSTASIALDSLNQLDSKAHRGSQASTSSEEYNSKAVPDHKLVYSSDHDSDADDDSNKHPYAHHPANAEEDVCFPFTSQYQEKHNFGPSADINITALQDYLQNSQEQDTIQSLHESDNASRGWKGVSQQDDGNLIDRDDEFPMYDNYKDSGSRVSEIE